MARNWNRASEELKPSVQELARNEILLKEVLERLEDDSPLVKPSEENAALVGTFIAAS